MSLTPQCVPALRRGVRRQFDKVRNAPVLMAPERVLVLDDIADAIVGECNAIATVQQIARTLALRFAAPAELVQADVMQFLDELVEKGLVNA